MAMQYTKKKDEENVKTVNASEFIQRLIDSKRTPEEKCEQPKIEATE